MIACFACSSACSALLVVVQSESEHVVDDLVTSADGEYCKHLYKTVGRIVISLKLDTHVTHTLLTRNTRE